MIRLLAIVSTALILLPCNGQSSNVIYKQSVQRDDLFFIEMFSHRGTILLTQDSLIFKIRRNRPSELNFSLAYGQIKSIKVFYGFLIPNRIKIKSIEGTSYRLFTYKKRKIIQLTREKMAVARSD